MEKINPLAGKGSRACSGRSGFIAAVLLIMIFSTISTGKLTGQTTYTWDGGAGDNLWTSAANWNPDRTTPLASDIIQFNTGTSLEILGVPFGHYITRMSVTGNTNVTLKPGTTLNVDGEIYVNAPDANALYIEAGSILSIAGRDIAGTTNDNILMFNLANVAGTGATIAGTLRNSLDNGQLEAHGYYDRKGTTQLFNFLAGSVYEQAINGGYIPYGTWAEGSTCLITGTVFSRPRFRETDVYADIVWNCPGQTGVADFEGFLRTVGGDLTVESTGTSIINFGQYVSTDLTINGDYMQQGGSVVIAPFEASTFSRKMTVRGNFTLAAGTMRLSPRYSTAVLEVDGLFTSSSNFFFHVPGYNASATVNANGDCVISGGTFNMSSAGSSLGTMNVKGNFSHTGGTITENGLAGDIIFSGTGVQIFTSTGGTVTEMINFSVNSGAFLQTADAGTIITSGSGGTFTLNTGGTLGIKSPLGIETSGSAGNIQTTNRYFNEGANYVYNGSAAQVTGSGLTQNIPAGLEINNSAGVALSGTTEISGLLKMTSGILDLANTSFSAGSLTGSSDITNNTGTPAAVTVTIGSDDSNAPAYSGAISNGNASSVALTKTGDGTLILSGTNAWTGTTTISGGILELGSETAINDNSQIVLDGGTLSTGSGAGFGETLGTLALSSSSSISLGSGSHELHFSAGSAWLTGEVLTIYGWSGSFGTSGTAGRIFVGSDNEGLNPDQLSAVNFYGYGNGALILSDGEIVPFTEPQITISSPSPAVPAGDILQATPNNVIYRLDIYALGGNAVLTSMQATLAGTYVAADMTSLKAWYSTDNVFTTDDILLSTIVSSGPGLHAFSPWTNQEIVSGTTGYIFITADLPCEATADNTVYVNAMTTSDITVTSGTKSGTAYSGGIQTIISVIPDNPTDLLASLASNQSSLSWTNPGCFTEIMIVGSTNSSLTDFPSGDGSSYSSNLFFGTTGTDFGGGFIVYKGTVSPQTVTNLVNGTTYYFTFFTRNGDLWNPTGITINVTPVPESQLAYRSITDGSWSDPATWEVGEYGGSSWTPATTAPDYTRNQINILNGHTVTVGSPVTVDQVIVEPGGKVTVNNVTLTIADGAGDDFTVNGTVELTGSSGVITATGNLIFGEAATYIHNRNGGTIPIALWADNATCSITGITSTSPSIPAATQPFGNFTWNCTSQSAQLDLGGQLTSIDGNFNLISTNFYPARNEPFYLNLGRDLTSNIEVKGNYVQSGGILGLGPKLSLDNRTMTVDGDFNLTSNGIFYISPVSGTGSLYVKGNLTSSGTMNFSYDPAYGATPTLTVEEATNIEGGYFYLSKSNLAGTFNVKGNFSHTGGTVGVTAGTGEVIFNGTGIQTYTSGGTVTSSAVNFTVSTGSFLQMAEASTTITGAGTFTLSPGATLGITSPDGITTSGTSGNILTTGTRVYSNEANYIYNGTGSQVSGNGLPLQVNSLLLSGTTDFTLTNLAAKNAPFTTTNVLEISSGTRMTVSPLQAVTVGTDLVNDGNLDLESDASGIASLMINGEYSGEGNAKSEIYMTGGDAGSEMWRWHYFAVPSQQSPEDLASDYGLDIMNYIDVTGMTDKSEGWNWFDGWEGTTPFANLNVSNGYAFYNDNDVTMEINSGSLPSSQGTVNLNYGTFGWNLLGNSLTCGLNWDNVTFTGQVDHSVSFIKDYEEYYYVQGGPGVPSGTSGSIPPLQGFFVQALESGASIDFSGAKEHNATAYYKGEGGKAEKGTDLSILRLSLVKDDRKDEMVIWFKEEATMGYDYMYDAEKWYSEGTRPQIYSVLSEKEYAINGIPFPETSAEIPLAFWAPEEGSYTINLTELENIEQCEFYLKDLVLNTKTSLTGNDSYTFSSPAGAVNDRFIIAIENMTTSTEDTKVSEKPFKVYDSFGFINIELLDEAWEGKSGFVKVVDISGRTLLDSRNETFSRSSLIRLPMENRKGVFVVEIVSVPRRYVTRVMIK